MKKSFRGLLAHEGQDTIRLSTNNGLTGYKITKFQGIGETPAGSNSESLLKLYKYKQDTITEDINFEDGTLLGIVYCLSLSVIILYSYSLLKAQPSACTSLETCNSVS